MLWYVVFYDQKYKNKNKSIESVMTIKYYSGEKLLNYYYKIICNIFTGFYNFHTGVLTSMCRGTSLTASVTQRYFC